MVKRFFGLLGVAMLGLGLSTTALHADLPKVGEIYANVGLAWLDVAFEGRSSVGNANDLPQDIDVAAGVLQIGKQINEYIAAELRLGFGATEKTHEYEVHHPNQNYIDVVANHELEIGVDHFIGGYLRFGGFATDSFYPYAIIGYTRLKASWESEDAPFKYEDSHPNPHVIAPTISTSPGFTKTDTSATGSFGIGFIHDSPDGADWGLEIMQYISDDDFGDVKALTVNIIID